MVSLKNVRKLEKFISKLALSLKKHFRMNIGVFLFATFLEMLATYKLVGKVIARQRAIIVRRIRANREIELKAQNLLSTAHLGLLKLSPVDKDHVATWLSCANGWKKIRKQLSKKRKTLLWKHPHFILSFTIELGFYRKWRITATPKSKRNKKRTSKDCPYAGGSRRSWILSPFLLRQGTERSMWSFASVATVARLCFRRYSQLYMVSYL